MIQIPEECSACRGKLPDDAVLARESQAPGLELDGDPLRIVGWCREHAPAWALERECSALSTPR